MIEDFIEYLKKRKYSKSTIKAMERIIRRLLQRYGSTYEINYREITPRERSAVRRYKEYLEEREPDHRTPAQKIYNDTPKCKKHGKPLIFSGARSTKSKSKLKCVDCLEEELAEGRKYRHDTYISLTNNR